MIDMFRGILGNESLNDGMGRKKIFSKSSEENFIQLNDPKFPDAVIYTEAELERNRADRMVFMTCLSIAVFLAGFFIGEADGRATYTKTCAEVPGKILTESSHSPNGDLTCLYEYNRPLGRKQT